MTPDTAALRALVDTYVTGWYLTAAEIRALCDAADEVERLRTWVTEAQATIRRMDAATLGALNEALGRKSDLGSVGGIEALAAERDASRTAHAAFIADLRALVGEWEASPWSWLKTVAAPALLALLARHAPTTGATP